MFPFFIKIAALDKFTSEFANLSNKMDRVGKKARNLGKSITLGVSAPLAAFGTLAVREAAKFESLRVALETSTGSAEAGAAAFKELQKFAATTPFQLEEMVSGFIKLKNRGMDPSREALIAYGNTAGAMGKSIDQMIEAVADASTFEFERLKEFGIKANKEGNKITFTFRGIKTTVRKDATEVEEYLKRIGLVDFAGGMEKQAATIGGAFSNLKDSVSSALDIVGTDIAKSIDLNKKVRAFSDTINTLAEKFNMLPQPVKDFVVNLGIAGVVIGPLVAGIGQMIIGMGLMVALLPQIAAGFSMLLVAAPWIALAGLVGAIVYKFVQLSKQVGGVKNAVILLGTALLDFIMTPMRHVLNIIQKIWGLFGKPPAILTKMVNGSLTRDMAIKLRDAEQGRQAAGARQTLSGASSLYAQQSAAMNQARAKIEVDFKNMPAGARTKIVSDNNADVAVEQGRSMEAVY